jgi:small-conductance mechanosensitive channel
MLEQIQNLLQDPLILKTVYAGIGILVIFVISGLLRRLSIRIKSESPVKYQLRKTISFVAYLVAVFLVMSIFEVNLGGLGIALGVAGAGIAFALQEVITSIAGYLAVHLAGFYKVGDRVQLGGIKGDVIDIGVLRTTMMEIGDWITGDLYNGKMVRVANSFVFKEPVFNYSANFPFLWDEITIPLKTSSDHRYARQMLQGILEDVVGSYTEKVSDSWKKMTDHYQIEKARLEPFVAMSFDENWITFTLRYVVDFKGRRKTKDLLFTRILDAISDSKGQVEVASAAYEITAFPSLKLHRQN